MEVKPRGYFEFTSNGNKIEGRVCTWSLNRFSKKMGDLNVTELLQAVTTGMSIEGIAQILLCSVEYFYKKQECPYTIDDSLDWIDDIGGIGVAVNLIESSLSPKDEQSGTEEKKSE